MNNEFNRKLYSTVDVLNERGATYEDWAQRFYVLSRAGGKVKAFKRFGRRKFVPETLRVPRTAGGGEDVVTVARDGGGSIFSWVFTGKSGKPCELVNHWGSFGRGIQNDVSIWETVGPIGVAQVIPGASTRVVLTERHEFPPSRVIDGRDVLTVVVEGLPGLDGTYGTFISGSGADYRRTILLPVNTADRTFPDLKSARVSFKFANNPTQGGDRYTADPASNDNPGDRQVADAASTRGSPLDEDDIVVKMLAPNQGYLEASYLPLEFIPEIHGGGPENPVVWDGLPMKFKLWVNYKGLEGCHRWTWSLHNELPVFIGKEMGVAFDAFFRYACGAPSGQPVARIVSRAPDGKMTMLGAASGAGDLSKVPFIEVDHPGVPKGVYFDSTHGDTELILSKFWAKRGAEYTEWKYPDNPFFDAGNGSVAFASFSAPDDGVTIGLFGNAKPGSTFQRLRLAVVGADQENNRYDAAQYGAAILSAGHAVPPTGPDGVLAPGDYEASCYIVTGDASELFADGFPLLTKMLALD